jgi:hypothetical protein
MLAYGTVAMALPSGAGRLKGFVHRAIGSWATRSPDLIISNSRPGQPSARKQARTSPLSDTLVPTQISKRQPCSTGVFFLTNLLL